MLYNVEIKTQFLVEITQNENSRTTYKYVLMQIAAIEEQLNMDLCEFTAQQLVDTVTQLEISTTKAFNKIRSVINQYRLWAVQHNFIQTNETLERVKTTTQIILNDRDQLYKLCTILDNAQDAAVVVLAYEGLKANDIVNLKVEDLDVINNTITLSRGQVKLDSRSMEVLLKAIQQEHYIKNGLNPRSQVTPIYHNNFVIRYTGKRGLTNQPITQQSIYKRIRHIGSIADFFKAGLINYISETHEDFKAVNVRYGLDPKQHWATQELYKSVKEVA